MPKTIIITITEEEFQLLKEVASVTDFYADGYDDMGTRSKPSDEIFSDLVGKIITEYNKP